MATPKKATPAATTPPEPETPTPQSGAEGVTLNYPQAEVLAFAYVTMRRMFHKRLTYEVALARIARVIDLETVTQANMGLRKQSIAYAYQLSHQRSEEGIRTAIRQFEERIVATLQTLTN